MKIENGSLIVTVQSVEKTVPLPTVAADAKVRAVRAAKRLEVNVAYNAEVKAIEGEKGAFKLTTTKGQVIGTPQDLAMDCIAHLEEQGEWGRIASVWNLSRESQSPEERLEGVGRRLGRLLPGGVVDLDGAGRAFLEALGTGKLGRWSLEVPPASREKEGSS